MSFDLVVIGSGPAGQKAALNAAKMGKSVAIIERQLNVGGVCIHTGTIPSKAMREAEVSAARPQKYWASPMPQKSRSASGRGRTVFRIQ